MNINSPKRKMRIRILVSFVTFTALLTLLGVRLVFLQIVDGDTLSREALQQQTRDSEVASNRGVIYDRNLKKLAQSAAVETVTANPNEIQKAKKDINEISLRLSDVLGVEKETISKELSKKVNHVVLKRKVDSDTAAKVRELNLTGIYLQEDAKRVYPFGKFASHVIGFTGFDNQGLGGIEMVYDNQLKGVPGRVISLKNALDSDMPFKEEKHIDPENGTNVVLTIDETIQHFVEKHLENAYYNEKVQKGAAGIVMDVKTGGILAMATMPDYDLNAPFELIDETEANRIKQIANQEEKISEQNKALQKMWRNKAVVDTYEPGSCFKIITACMALEEGLVNMNTPFFCSGAKVVGPTKIRCANVNGHGAQTFVEAVKNSCNPAFIEIGQKVGHDLFYKYYKAFGFTETTGFDLPGEASGIFHAMENFNEVELATSAFGQSFQITPLQLISAVSSVANGGKLMKPYLVQELVDDDGNIIKSTEPTVVRQVISKQTSDTMCSLLENVVANGTGQNAYIKGYRLAGKTGTSEKRPRGNGKYIASFIGFAPANDPKVCCLILLDEPSNGEYYGGRIAAPVVGKIMEDIMRYLNVEQQFTEEEKESMDSFVPDVKGLNVQNAAKRLAAESLKYKVIGSGDTVKDQMPKVGANLTANSVVILYMDDGAAQEVTVPNVYGMPLSDVQATLGAHTLNMSIVSAGATGSTSARTIAIVQDPAPGTVVPAGTVVRVEFRFLDVD